MPQNEHIELHRKRHGRRLDHEEGNARRRLGSLVLGLPPPESYEGSRQRYITNNDFQKRFK